LGHEKRISQDGREVGIAKDLDMTIQGKTEGRLGNMEPSTVRKRREIRRETARGGVKQ